MNNNFHYKNVDIYDKTFLAERIALFPYKLYWFTERGYTPHAYQLLFHTMNNSGKLCRFRHLVAGRRGGKTLSAAWEYAHYASNPESYWRDFFGEDKSDPLHMWILSKDHVIGRAALLTLRTVLRESGLVDGVDYKENRGLRFIEFANDSLIEFKTADDPQNLRGAGLNMLWIDEAAFLVDKEAYEVARPALADKLGAVITTTTPFGRNWFYNEFWSPESLADPFVGRVEYRSIDNPHFSKDEWEYLLHTYHPIQFAQEFMASFDSMLGLELQGDWLHFYEPSEIPPNEELNLYMGVDPAVSLSDDADRFSMALIGVTKDNSQVYLIEQFAGRIPFADQVEKIAEWYQLYRPQLIGIEDNAYQAVLAQQVARLDFMPPVIGQPAKGKKSQRILAMSPMFRIARVKIRKSHKDFINEWIAYDSTKSNPDDDCLDSVEIALRTAGILLPMPARKEEIFDFDTSVQGVIRRKIQNLGRETESFDEHLGGAW